MAFEFKKCDIEGLYEIQPKIIFDNRGYFLESYSDKEFIEAGLTMKFVQDNQSFSKKNVIRGLHFQTKHAQGKIIKMIDGKIFDVAVDLRNESKTFGKYFGTVLDSEKQNMLYIPKGFAHGFCVLTENATVSYKCSDYYHPEDEYGLMWNDPLIGIDWNSAVPNLSEKIILSEKDKDYSIFNPNKKYFDLNGNWIGE